MARKSLAVTEDTPLLKPYAGAGSPNRRRRIVATTAVITGLICLPYGFYYALLTPWMLVPFIVPVAILLAIMIWTLPEARTAPLQTMERMLFVLFAILIAWPNYLAITFPGLPWITLSRLVGTPLVILFLISLSISSQFRARLASIIKDSPSVWICIATFSLLQLTSIAFSNQVGYSISQYVVQTTNQTAVFFLCAYFFVRRGRAELWGALMWGVAIFVSLIGLYEYRIEHVLWTGHVPGFLLPNDPTVMKILEGSTRGTTGEYRAQSVFTTSLGFSEFLALSITFPLHFAVTKGYAPWIRWAGFASVPFLVVVILDSGSRLGLLGFFLATMLYLLIWALRLQRRDRGSLMAPTVLISYPVLFSAFIVASLFVGRIKAKVWGMGQYEDSNEARREQWRMGMPKILTHPLGHGIGTAADTLGYANLAGNITIDSFYLSVLLDYGLIGFIAFIGIFVFSALRGGFYAMQDDGRDRDIAFLLPLSASLVAFLAMKTFFAQEDNNPIAFMMAGIIVALIHRVRTQRAAAAGANTAAR